MARVSGIEHCRYSIMLSSLKYSKSGKHCKWFLNRQHEISNLSLIITGKNSFYILRRKFVISGLVPREYLVQILGPISESEKFIKYPVQLKRGNDPNLKSWFEVGLLVDTAHGHRCHFLKIDLKLAFWHIKIGEVPFSPNWFEFGLQTDYNRRGTLFSQLIWSWLTGRLQ